MAQRYAGVSRGIAYGLDGVGGMTSLPVSDATPTATGGWVTCAYDSSLTFNSDEIDVTAYGDFPYKASVPGFIDLQLTLSCRHETDSEGALTPSLAFLEDAYLGRKQIRLAVIDNRQDISKSNGFLSAWTVVSMENSGEFSSAQDKNFTLKRASSSDPDFHDLKIRKGVVSTVDDNVTVTPSGDVTLPNGVVIHEDGTFDPAP